MRKFATQGGAHSEKKCPTYRRAVGHIDESRGRCAPPSAPRSAPPFRPKCPTPPIEATRLFPPWGTSEREIDKLGSYARAHTRVKGGNKNGSTMCPTPRSDLAVCVGSLTLLVQDEALQGALAYLRAANFSRRHSRLAPASVGSVSSYHRDEWRKSLT